MSNIDSATTITEPWPDRPLSETQQRNRESAALIPVSRSGAIPMNFAQMVDYAKFMSTAKGAVGAHLMGNVGACLAVMEIANQFGLPAYAVARQSYLVNGRIAFMGQFFHSIVEDYAPLEKGKNGRKLQFRYEGEGDTLKIIVSGTFKGASEAVTYESPILKDIRIKNSPLWKDEPKRQLIYFGVRGWQTINWSEGMMHAISEDEAAALPPSDYARDITPIAELPEATRLRERLAAQNAGGEPREGFREGAVEAHFEEVVVDPAAKAADATIERTIEAAKGHPEPPVKASEPAAAPSEPATKPKAKGETKPPKTIKEWVPYCMEWLDAENNPTEMRRRWQDELKLRNDLGVTSEERDPVFEHYQERLSQLEGRG